MAADLLRAGAGLNPMVSPRSSVPRPRLRGRREIGAAGARSSPSTPGYSPAYYAGTAPRGESHEGWSFAVSAGDVPPDFNLALGVPTALSLDQTMLAPEARVLAPQTPSRALSRAAWSGCGAAVSHVLALEPFRHPDLEA